MDESKVPDVSVIEYTVSHTFDTFRDGRKSSHFVSMKFSPSRPLSKIEAEAAALVSSVTVTRATIYQALARGAISIEEANELSSNMKTSHDHIYTKKFEPVLKKLMDPSQSEEKKE